MSPMEAGRTLPESKTSCQGGNQGFDIAQSNLGVMCVGEHNDQANAAAGAVVGILDMKYKRRARNLRPSRRGRPGYNL